jgi:hypothetical protein
MKAAANTRAGPPIKRSVPGLRITGTVVNFRLRRAYQDGELTQACIAAWKDHGTGLGGDADFRTAAGNLPKTEGARKLIELAERQLPT